MKGKFKFSQRSIDRMKGVHPDLVSVCHEAIKITPYDFGISCGVRTKEEQAELYAQGRTKPGKIVTWTMDSRHISGHAVDFVVYQDGKVTWEEKYYDQVGGAFLEAAAKLGIPVTWGGSWKRPDRPHVELNRGFYD